MNRRRAVPGVLLAASVLVVASCSGGSSSADLTLPASVVDTTLAPVDTAPEVTVAETTPATPAPTEVPESTEAATTTDEPVPESTEAPPATTAELTIEEQINRDLALGEEALAAAAADPGSAAARDGVARYFGGENLDALLALYDQLLERKWIGVPNPNTPSLTTLFDDVVTKESETVATATICRVDSGIVLEPGDPDTPNDDFIINADITRYVFEGRLELQDGHWKRVENLGEIAETRGATTCDE